MYDNKVLVNLYVVSLDKNFEIYIPVNEKVGNVIKMLSRGLFNEEKNMCFINTATGSIYKNNDLVRNVDINNGIKLLLI